MVSKISVSVFFLWLPSKHAKNDVLEARSACSVFTDGKSIFVFLYE